MRQRKQCNLPDVPVGELIPKPTRNHGGRYYALVVPPDLVVNASSASVILSGPMPAKEAFRYNAPCVAQRTHLLAIECVHTTAEIRSQMSNVCHLGRLRRIQQDMRVRLVELRKLRKPTERPVDLCMLYVMLLLAYKLRNSTYKQRNLVRPSNNLNPWLLLGLSSCACYKST